MNFIHIPIITIAICKTILHIQGDLSGLTFQWLFLITFKQIADLFEGYYPPSVLCAIGEIVLALLTNTQLIKCASIIDQIPTERILTEIKYQASVVVISTMSRVFKFVFLRVIQLIEKQNLNDERQSKLSQQLLDVSQYIEIETQQRCNKSNFFDQTLNLNETIIEKTDDFNRDNTNILKDLEQNSAIKQVEEQPQPQQPVKKPPQTLLKASIPMAQVMEKALPMPQKASSLRGSISGVQSCDVDSMRKTLDLLRNSDKKKMEEVVIETLQSRVQQSKLEQVPQSGRDVFEKLQQAKRNISKQQQSNAQLFGSS